MHSTLTRTLILISIHAPRTGSDEHSSCVIVQPKTFQSTLPARGATSPPRQSFRRWCNFNPRSPHGERQRKAKLERTATLFQSTLPARGATRGDDCDAQSQKISIHAPRTGSDCYLGECLGAEILFQSTLPARGATVSRYSRRILTTISIHAPRTGSDWKDAKKLAKNLNFNPRSPHGERLDSVGGHKYSKPFQSTLPARGATLSPAKL